MSTEHIGTEFIHFVVDIIEQPPDADDDQDQLSDIMVNLLIALNQQFDDAVDNVVVQAMRDVPVAKTFTEKILVLLNRDGMNANA